MTDPKVYRAPHVNHRDTILAANGVDDCLVVSCLAFTNTATLGEATRSPAGHEPTQKQLTRFAKRMRSRLDDPDTARAEFQTGSLPPSAFAAMIGATWPALPPIGTRDINHRELIALVEDGHVAAIAINPSRIVGPSPLKRVGDVGHAVCIKAIRTREGSKQFLVDDPFRVGGKQPAGEWIPVEHIRQAAFRDSDGDLTAVWTVRIGSWQAERITSRRLTAEKEAIEATLTARVRKLRNELIECRETPAGDCEPAIKAAVAEAKGAVVDAVVAHAGTLR